MSKTKQRKSTAGKSIAIFFIVFIILEGLIIFGLKTIFKTEDSVPSLGNYSFFLMDSDKMSPSIPKNTLVIAVNGTPSADKLRNAVLCRNVGSEGTTVAWLYMIGSKGDTVNGVVYTVFQCQGDEPENDPNVEYIDVESADVIGVATSHYMTAGKIVSFVISPFGMVICLAVPLIMLVLLELVVAITNRSEDDSYEPEGYGRDPRFYNDPRQQQGQRGQKGPQNGNASLDDFLYGGSNDEVYNGGRPDEDYAEEFAEDRRAPANRQQRPGKPDFNLNDEYGDDFEEENDPFGDEEENSFADSVFGQSEEEAPAQFYKPDEAPEAEPFADDDDFEEDEIFAESAPAAPAQPAVDREYYEKAARMIEGDDYQPAPAPAPAPVPQPKPAPAQPVMNLEKPAAPARQQAPARQPAPARAEQPARQPVQRRRPAQPPQGAPRRRPAGGTPTRQGAAPQRRPRPAQPRPGAQRRPVPHKNANAALADLTAKMQAEQQKLGNKQ